MSVALFSLSQAPPPPLPPLDLNGGGATLFAGEGVGRPNSDDWKEYSVSNNYKKA